MAQKRINQLPLATGSTAPVTADAIAIDGLTTRKITLGAIADVINPPASQAEAEEGINSVKRMTPLTTKQHVDSRIGTAPNTIAAGDDSRITGASQKSSNLSDLTNAVTARINLGLGGAAILSVGTAAGTVAAGDDSRILNGARALTEVRDFYFNVKRDPFNLTMDGNNADTGKFADMIASAGAHTYFIPEGQLNINDEIPDFTGAGLRFLGAGQDKTKFKVTTSGVTHIFKAASGCGPLSIENMALDVTGYATRILETAPFFVGAGFSLLRMRNLSLLGDQAGDLVYLGLFGDDHKFENIEMLLGSNNTIGITLDTGPHNVLINGLTTYGPGSVGAGGIPLRIAQSYNYTAAGVAAAAHRVEGVNVYGFYNKASGPKCVEIGTSLNVAFFGAIFDQFTQTGVEITGDANSGADGFQIFGGYVGSDGITGVLISEYCGNGVHINGLRGNNLDYMVDIRATASRRTANHTIHVEAQAIRKSIVRDDSSGSDVVVKYTGPHPTTNVTEGAIHLKDTNGGGAQTRISNTDTPSIVVDAGVAMPTGVGNSGALSWINYRAVSLGRSAVQSIPNGSVTAVLWTVEDFDGMNVHAANAATIVIPKGVNVARFDVGTLWGINSVGNRVIQLRVNGTVVMEWKRPAKDETPDSRSRIFAVSAGQVWDVAVFQDSTGTIDLAVGSYFQMTAMG